MGHRTDYGARFVVCAFVLILTACQSGGAGKTPVQLPAGPVHDQIVAGGEIIPLPPGAWEPVARIERSSNGAASWSSQRLILASRVGDVVDRYVMVMTQRLTSHPRYNLTRACISPSFHHSAARSVNAASNDCWHVRTLSLGLAGTAHELNTAIAEHADRENLYAPLAIIGPRFVRSVGQYKIQVEYYWNVDLLDPRFDGNPADPAGWSKQAVADDPAKKAALDAIVLWSEEWYGRLGRKAPAS